MTSALLITLAAFAANDAPVSVNVTLGPPVIPFHRQAQFTIAVEAPEGVDITFPDMLERFGGLNVYGTPTYSMEPRGDGRVLRTETYTLDAVFVGDYAIAPVTVEYGDGESVVVPSPGLRVRELTEAEQAEAEQFESAIALPPTPTTPVYQSWRFWTFLLALAILAAVGAIYWLRRRKPQLAVVEHIPAWERAYRRLRELDERHLPEQGKYEPYYVDLSAILRYYIEDRFQLHAPEMTTPEFLDAASRSGVVTGEQQQRIATFLRHCDLVKFAQYKPSVQEMEESFTKVLTFVDETVPTETDTVQPPGEAAA